MVRPDQLLSLDRKIATNIFGQRLCESYVCSVRHGIVHVIHEMVDGCSSELCVLNINNQWPPPYSSDIAAAWKLVEKYNLSIIKSDSGWTVESKSVGISIEREHAPLAISLVSWLIHSSGGPQ